MQNQLSSQPVSPNDYLLTSVLTVPNGINGLMVCCVFGSTSPMSQVTTSVQLSLFAKSVLPSSSLDEAMPSDQQMMTSTTMSSGSESVVISFCDENTPPRPSSLSHCDDQSNPQTIVTDQSVSFLSLPLSPSTTPPISLTPPSIAIEQQQQKQQQDPLSSVGLFHTDGSTVVAEQSAWHQSTHSCDSNLSGRSHRDHQPSSSNHRFDPYRSSSTSRSIHHHHSHSHQHHHNVNSSVLRPINDHHVNNDVDGVMSTPGSSSSTTPHQCDTNLQTNSVTSQLIHSPGPQPPPTSTDHPDSVHRSHSSCVLQIDTSLANRQSTANCRSHPVSHQHRTQLAKQILSVIRKGDFDKFLKILSRSKPDLNVFLNGQTALHYCLMFGRDVSWCRQLILNGANPNLSSQDGWHPIHLAAYRGLKDNLNFLLSCNHANTGLNEPKLTNATS